MAMSTRSLPSEARFVDPNLTGGHLATPTRARMHVPVNAIALALFLAVCGGVALDAASYADTGPGTWYAALEKPSMPPSWALHVAIAAGFVVLASTAWLVWRRAGPEPDRRVALGVFAVELVLTAAWAPVFFGQRSPEVAMLVIAALWLTALAMVLTYAPVEPWSLLPALNAAIVIMN
jgi:tryptophan-rich sensory protein